MEKPWSCECKCENKNPDLNSQSTGNTIIAYTFCECYLTKVINSHDILVHINVCVVNTASVTDTSVIDEYVHPSKQCFSLLSFH